MFLSASLMLGDLVVGNITNSITLVADSFFMLYNALTLAVMYFSIKASSKKWNRSTFGWARVKAVGTVINSVLLLSLCFHISLNSFKRILVPEEIGDPLFILITGGISLSINILRVLLLSDQICPDSEDSIQSEGMDTAGVFINNIREVLSSAVVIVSALAFWFSGWEHRHCFDPLLSLLMVVNMTMMVWPLLHDSSLVLLNCVPEHLKMGELSSALLESDPSVCSICQLEVWRLAGSRVVADCHIKVHTQELEEEKDIMSQHDIILSKVKKLLNVKGISDTTVQICHCRNAKMCVDVCKTCPNNVII